MNAGKPNGCADVAGKSRSFEQAELRVSSAQLVAVRQAGLEDMVVWTRCVSTLAVQLRACVRDSRGAGRRKQVRSDVDK